MCHAEHLRDYAIARFFELRLLATQYLPLPGPATQDALELLIADEKYLANIAEDTEYEQDACQRFVQKLFRRFKSDLAYHAIRISKACRQAFQRPLVAFLRHLGAPSMSEGVRRKQAGIAGAPVRQHPLQPLAHFCRRVAKAPQYRPSRFGQHARLL